MITVVQHHLNILTNKMFYRNKMRKKTMKIFVFGACALLLMVSFGQIVSDIDLNIVGMITKALKEMQQPKPKDVCKRVLMEKNQLIVFSH